MPFSDILSFYMVDTIAELVVMTTEALRGWGNQNAEDRRQGHLSVQPDTLLSIMTSFEKRYKSGQFQVVIS